MKDLVIASIFKRLNYLWHLQVHVTFIKVANFYESLALNKMTLNQSEVMQWCKSVPRATLMQS